MPYPPSWFENRSTLDAMLSTAIHRHPAQPNCAQCENSIRPDLSHPRQRPSQDDRATSQRYKYGLLTPGPGTIFSPRFTIPPTADPTSDNQCFLDHHPTLSSSSSLSLPQRIPPTGHPPSFESCQILPANPVPVVTRARNIRTMPAKPLKSNSTTQTSQATGCSGRPVHIHLLPLSHRVTKTSFFR